MFRFVNHLGTGVIETLLLLFLPFVFGMAFAHGKDTVVWLDNGAGTLTNITAFLNQASIDRMADVAETTVFGLSNKTYIAGLKDGTISIEGRFDPAIDTIMDADLGAALTKSVEYGPEGGTTGKIKYSMEVIVTSYTIDNPLDDVVTFSAELQMTGVVTRGTFA